MRIVFYQRGDLVKSHQGTMPIILTCPHGGTLAPPEVAERTSAATPTTCTGINRYVTSGDALTAEITEAVAQKILDVTGLSPYVVIAQFDRLYIDANRPAECAFTDPAAASFYDEYHDRIATDVTEILRLNQNRGFLFDIHGTWRDVADLYLGTANGSTLVNGVTRDDLLARHGLRGLLRDSRHLVDGPAIFAPAYNVSPNPRNDDFGPVNGGYTVRHYSSTMSINSIQIEIRDEIRNDDVRREFVQEDLAFALINFVRRYAPF